MCIVCVWVQYKSAGSQCARLVSAIVTCVQRRYVNNQAKPSYLVNVSMVIQCITISDTYIHTRCAMHHHFKGKIHTLRCIIISRVIKIHTQ